MILVHPVRTEKTIDSMRNLTLSWLGRVRGGFSEKTAFEISGEESLSSRLTERRHPRQM